MNKKGFTLIELLIVMTIIAILAGLALVSYQSARKSARDGKRKAELEEVRSALEMYRADCDAYLIGTLYSGSDITCDSNTYMTIPSDPNPAQRYRYDSSDGVTYDLCTTLEIGGGSVSGCGGSDGCGTGVSCNYKTTNP